MKSQAKIKQQKRIKSIPSYGHKYNEIGTAGGSNTTLSQRIKRAIRKHKERRQSRRNNRNQKR